MSHFFSFSTILRIMETAEIFHLQQRKMYFKVINLKLILNLEEACFKTTLFGKLHSVDNYMFKVLDESIRLMCLIDDKLNVKS